MRGVSDRWPRYRPGVNRPHPRIQPGRRGAVVGGTAWQRPASRAQEVTAMKWNIRRTAAAVIVLPAVLGVAACGKSETPAPAPGQAQTSASSAATTDASAQPYQDKASFVAAMKAAGKSAT